MWSELSVSQKIVIIYFVLISIVSIIITVYDKKSAQKRPQSRIPEAKLLLFSLLGGSLAMYITMQSVRHKTQHIKFMLGIPLIMIFQIILIYFLFLFFNPVNV